MIELSNITVSRSGVPLYQNFSFTIRAGEHWVIQGDNGAGKTLLLQLIAGATHPLSGSVHYSFIRGDDWESMYRERLDKIHFVPSHGLQAFLGGFQELFYQQRYYSLDDTHLPTVRDVLGDDYVKLADLEFSETFQIHNLLGLPVTRLSNGQLRKVVIMRQLIKNIPQFLLLDYPFEGLDAASRHDLSAFIDQLALNFGIQIVLVDHGPALPAVISRRLVLDQFRIEKTEVVSSSGAVAARPGRSVEFQSASATGDAVVEMQDLTIKYGEKEVLSHVNWRINRGERWALTGRNGSGKTTLFSLIYADHPLAYSQKVFLFGKRRGTGESIWDIKKRINYLGPEQGHFLNPKSILDSGRQHILAQAHSDHGRLTALIDFFGAARYIDLPMRYLSSGQLQIVLLMNMFLDDRELLLLDEPFQFLDPHNHQRVTEYLNRYVNKDITLVLITHDEKDVAQWTQLRKHLP